MNELQLVVSYQVECVQLITQSIMNMGRDKNQHRDEILRRFTVGDVTGSTGPHYIELISKLLNP
jgi:hypothetical protein